MTTDKNLPSSDPENQRDESFEKLNEVLQGLENLTDIFRELLAESRARLKSLRGLPEDLDGPPQG